MVDQTQDSGRRERAKQRRQAMSVAGCSTYEVVTVAMMSSITCCCCGRTSPHPGDVYNLYCSFCHEFHVKEQRDDAGYSGVVADEGGGVTQHE